MVTNCFISTRILFIILDIQFLGYKKGPNGEIAIDEEEAKVVKRIYFDFMIGKSAENIARELTRDGIKTPAGKDKWGKASVLAILSNEKYKGDALLQKTFVVNYLDHKKKKNEGEIPQYYVKNSHPWIISEEEWELVQIELRRRKELKYSYSYKNPFCAKLVCEDCGSSYGKKIWHSTTNRKEIFQCNNKFKHHCKTPHLMEDDVKRRFFIAYNRMYSNKEEILMNLENVKTLLTDTSKLEAKINSTKETLEEYAKEFRLLIDANTKTIQDQNIWKKKYAELEEKYKNKEEEYNKLIAEKDIKIAKSRWFGRYLQSYGIKVYPTVGWVDEDTYNICFAGLRDGSIFFISTLGVNNEQCKPLFLKGLQKLRTRFPNSKQICVGQKIEGIPDDVCVIPYENTFGGKMQLSQRNQIRLFNWDGTISKEEN